MSDNITSITFRMYNTGSVGDCLLLLFKKGNKVSFKMMIDCGGWNTNSAAISPVVEDIEKLTKGEIDLLVVTHQHEDHISGFNQARDVFDRLKVKEVWMSWIEDPTDSIGKILKDKYGKKLKQLKAITLSALGHINAAGSSRIKGFSERMQAKKGVMKQALDLVLFEEGRTYAKNLGVGKKTNDDAMDYVKGKGKRMQYWKPGTVIKDVQGAEGMKFFILGPPRDADMRYFQIDLEEEEMYKLALRGQLPALRATSKDGIFSNDIGLEEGISPFSEHFKMERTAQKEFEKEYNSSDMKWRQIETDWMETAASIALRVNRLTNNTSLAMAVEFTSGRVVLLPGDAQSGNWMGWHKKDVMKNLMKHGGKDTRALLKNTVFYKVGHHGSHNGTASKSGLDLVEHKDLVAAMPLVQDMVPKAWGGAKNFPARGLYDVLIEKTRGRVIRTDEGLITKSSAVAKRKTLSDAETKEFQTSFRKGKIFVEFEIKG